MHFILNIFLRDDLNFSFVGYASTEAHAVKKPTIGIYN